MLAVALFSILLIAVVYLAGPRVSLDTDFTLPVLPPDLDNYLHQSEGGCNDIAEGAEKTIHWANSETKEKTPFAFVYFHGFSATRQESMPVPEQIAEHFNSNIFYTRLTGNGRSDEAMAQGSVNSWINDASEAMAIAAQIGHRTIIIGSSTGASLGWWIANQPTFASQIEALVFFSPNFGLAKFGDGLLAGPWGKQLARIILGKYYETEVMSPEHLKYWSTRYPTESLLPMMGLVKLATRFNPDNFKKPVFIAYSPHDDTVDAKKIKHFYEQLPGPKEALVIDEVDATSQHVICGDILAPQNTKRATASITAFLDSELQSSASAS